LEEADNDVRIMDIGFDFGAKLDEIAAMVWNFGDDGIGLSDQYNPQLSPDTGVLARVMRTDTTNDNRQAALENGGAHGKHAFTLDLASPF
jgi:hypothetical protein